MQACHSGDLGLGVAKIQAGPDNGGIAVCASGQALKNRLQGRTVGKTLNAGDFLEGALVLEQGEEFFQERIVPEKALSFEIIPGRFGIKTSLDKEAVFFPCSCSIGAELFQNPVH